MCESHRVDEKLREEEWSIAELWTQSFVEAVTSKNTLSGFKSCGINPFDLAYLSPHLSSARLKKSEPSTLSTLDSPVSPLSPAHLVSGSSSPINRSISTKSDAGFHCTGNQPRRQK